VAVVVRLGVRPRCPGSGGVAEARAGCQGSQGVQGERVSIEQAVVQLMGIHMAGMGCGGRPIEPQVVEGARIAASGVRWDP
jgi:hypothetical protein